MGKKNVRNRILVFRKIFLPEKSKKWAKNRVKIKNLSPTFFQVHAYQDVPGCILEQVVQLHDVSSGHKGYLVMLRMLRNVGDF